MLSSFIGHYDLKSWATSWSRWHRAHRLTHVHLLFLLFSSLFFFPTVLHQVRAKTIMEICWTLQVGFSKSAFYGDKIILSVVCIFNQSSLIDSCKEHISRTSNCCLCISHWLFWHWNGFNAWINLDGTWLSMATRRCSLRFFLSRREAVTQISFQAFNIVKVESLASSPSLHPDSKRACWTCC